MSDLLRGLKRAAGISCLLLAVCLMAAGAPEQTSGVYDRSAGTGAVSADTLLYRVDGGQILILNLPDSIEGRAVTSYRPIRCPSLSWLVDRSFMWRTLDQDVGAHDFLVGVELAEAVKDTIVLRIVVHAP